MTQSVTDRYTEAERIDDMPIYSFVCPRCKDTSERNVSIVSRDDNYFCETCPVIHSDTLLVRLVDAPGAVYAPTAKGGLAT